ncbi:MAG: asparagine synthase-related protein, partial [Chloroflexi bacterium]|nr:asparagine synthase-related protein [Chloroflexota bacterium]
MFISVAVRQSEANNVVNVLRDRLDSIVSFVAAPHIVIVATKATPLINVYKVSNDRFLYVLGNSTLVRKPPHPQKVVPLSNTPETGTSRPELGSASDLVFDAGDSCFVEVNLSPLQITIVRPFPNGRDIYYMPLPESGFAFSLDPSLLVEMFPRHLELDLDTMVSLFRFAAPAPRRTLFANVRRPAAGMTVNWSPESGIDCWTAQCFEPDRVVELEKSIRTEEDAIALWSDALRGSVDTLATFYHDPATPEAVMLSGGIDSSLVLANLREVITGPILSLSLSDRSAKRRQPDELTERESIEFLSRKFRTNHHYFEVDTLVDLDRVSLYSENCFDGIGSALEYYLFLSAAEQTGFETLASGFCADGLIGDLAEYERVTREIQGIQPALALYKIRQFILERTTLRGLLRRMRMPSFLSGS